MIMMIHRFQRQSVRELEFVATVLELLVWRIKSLARSWCFILLAKEALSWHGIMVAGCCRTLNHGIIRLLLARMIGRVSNVRQVAS
jgi:hypothetical protein